MAEKLRIIVGGMVGNYPLGGVAWDYFHYLLALHELGHEVYYHEDTFTWPLNPKLGWMEETPDYTIDFFKEFFAAFAPHLADRWHYVLLREKTFGMSKEAFAEVAKTADIYLNVSGACFLPADLNPRCIKVFMDTDPGYNQILMYSRPEWAADPGGWKRVVEGHDVHLTYAENIYSDDCHIPRLGLNWRITRPVVTLAPWAEIKNSPPPAGAPYSTVMSWSYFKGPVEYEGVNYGAKVPEFEKFHALPQHTKIPLQLAVAGHHQPADEIRRDGWQLTDARQTTLTGQSYQDVIRASAGEWSIAKNVYVGTNSGWFSCRTACYLAAGRPAVVQDTAWSRYVPSGNGVFAFRTMDETVAALEAVASNPAHHQAAAYDIAREYLAADRIIPPMLAAIYAAKGENSRQKHLLPPTVGI